MQLERHLAEDWSLRERGTGSRERRAEGGLAGRPLPLVETESWFLAAFPTFPILRFCLELVLVKGQIAIFARK